MIKNMLIAASKMLEKSKDRKVQCAKTVIDEIVAGMEPSVKEEPRPILPVVRFAENPDDPAVKPAKPSPPKGKIMVDQGKIKSIEGVDLDTTMIELDGKAMTCAEAIGKSFQRGKIL